jgi:NAD(P)-dependent dehydrogenase (short-subunit alcohol dehydrogenase family)
MTITLITGANKGLGRESARRLLEIGHTVLIGARDAERGQRTADELGGVFLKIDPTSDASVAAAADQVQDEYGRLDVLVNNAGTAEPRVGATGTFQDRNGTVPW